MHDATTHHSDNVFWFLLWRSSIFCVSIGPLGAALLFCDPINETETLFVYAHASIHLKDKRWMDKMPIFGSHCYIAVVVPKTTERERESCRQELQLFQHTKRRLCLCVISMQMKIYKIKIHILKMRISGGMCVRCLFAVQPPTTKCTHCLLHMFARLHHLFRGNSNICMYLI